MADTLFDNQIFIGSLVLIFQTWWLWLPPVLFFLFWEVWNTYVQAAFTAKWKWVLLEIKVPREVAKSPKAMESILAGLHGSRRLGNFKERHWDGWTTAYFSLEIVGNSTGVHFYVYTQSFFRRMVETQIYAQYPSCEIREVEDYTAEVPAPLPNNEWTLWGSEFLLTKADAYPIRTYEDFNLEKISVKEEDTKIDPLAALIEFLGSLKGNEKFWIQMLVQPSGDEWQKEGAALVEKIGGKKAPPHQTFIGMFIDLVNGFLKVIFGAAESEPPKKEREQIGYLYLSPGASDTLKALENNMTKLGFDVGIRWIYVVPQKEFDYLAVPAIMGIFKQFNSPSLNGFKSNGKVVTSVDYWLVKTRVAYRKKRLYKAYRLRSFFHPPYRGKPFVLSTSELATIYHFPGMVAGAPAMERIDAKRGAAPPNLPI